MALIALGRKVTGDDHVGDARFTHMLFGKRQIEHASIVGHQLNAGPAEA